MKVKLPIQKTEIINGKVKKQKDYIDFDIDVSLASQIRYEKKFPELAKNEDLYGYSERIIKTKELTIAKILSEIKLLYCWIKTEIEFVDFVELFDLTDKEYVSEFIKSIGSAFDIILNSSSEKN